MRYQKTMLLAATCISLCACNAPDTIMANGAVTLKGDTVTLHVDGAPSAVIDEKGELQVGDKAITTKPPQQGLLVLYYAGVVDVRATGIQMAKVGTGMSVGALKDKLSSKSKEEAQRDAENSNSQMKTLQAKMCQDQINLKNTQNQLAAQLADFKPYSHIFTDDNTKCDEDESNASDKDND